MIAKKLNLLISIASEILHVLQQLTGRCSDQTGNDGGYLQNRSSHSSVKILDNADIKRMLKIGDTKLYYLKKKKILKPYKLDGKEVYLEHEVIEAIKRSDKF